MEDNDSQSVYVVVEFEGAAPPPGEPLHLQGLDTATPKIVLNDGTVFVGEFEETVGTQLVFSSEKGEEDAPSTVQLLCHTDKKIRFRKKYASSDTKLIR